MVISSDGALECQFCDLTFRDLAEKEEHEVTHTLESILVCRTCAEPCRDLESYFAHVRASHSVSAIFDCPKPGCEMAYMKAFWLENHILNKHVDSRTFKIVCEKCGKKFPVLKRLKTHLYKGECPKLVSVEDRTCKVCGVTYVSRNNLQTHLVTHDPANFKYVCKVKGCGKKFAYRNFLVRHQKTHSKEKPFTCPSCKLGFARLFNLCLHRRRKNH